VNNKSVNYPRYATVKITGNPDWTGKREWTWAESTDDSRALLQPSGAGRVAACLQADPTLTIDISISDGRAHQLALYFVDFDHLNRNIRVDVLNPLSDGLLDSRQLPSYQDGVYLIWNIKGQVKFSLTKNSGWNATVSGLFFDSMSPRGEPLDNAGNLKLLKAIWGAENTWVDVTAKVKDMVARGESSIEASGGVFGDPIFGHPKILKITYTLHGKQMTESIGEGASFKVPTIQTAMPQTGAVSGRQGLRIIKAMYGVGRQVVDVTPQLQSMIVNNAVAAGRGWDLCHCDPAGGQVKKTIVTYVYGGRKMEKEFGEYESVSLP
jgi:hypothetical protein